MQRDVRSLRRLVATFALALAGAALAPAAAGADTISYPNNTPGAAYSNSYGLELGEHFDGKVRFRIEYEGSTHLEPGQTGTLRGTAPDSDWSVGEAEVEIPANWGPFNPTVEGEAVYTLDPTTPADQIFSIPFTADPFRCDAGDACLNAIEPRDISVQMRPNAPASVAVDAGVTEANVSWALSVDDAVITDYRVVRYRNMAPQSLTLLPRGQSSLQDAGLDPGTQYCYRLEAHYNGSRGQVSSDPAELACDTTGQHPQAPASGVQGPAVDGDGSFDLTWGESSDADVRYDLEHRVESATEWTRIATGLEDTTFAAQEDEGRWVYRVRATSNGGGVSDWVESDTPVVVDLTAPIATTESCPSNPIVGEPASMTWSASDGSGSGIKDDSSSGTVALDTSTPGTRTATGPPPVDNVDRMGAAPECTYTVAYRFVGFLEPVDNDTLNVGKIDKTYPINWRLERYDGSLISDTAAKALLPTISAAAQATNCASLSHLPADTLEQAISGKTELRYDGKKDLFTYRFKAPKTVGCVVFSIAKADGANTKQAYFEFRR